MAQSNGVKNQTSAQELPPVSDIQDPVASEAQGELVADVQDIDGILNSLKTLSNNWVENPVLAARL